MTEKTSNREASEDQPDTAPNGRAATIPSLDKGKSRAWHLTLAYNGTAFHGWQIQSNQRTVQGELQKRLRLFFHDPELRLAATSRTDAGVHALDQHISFAAIPPADMDADRIKYSLNRWLPADMQITSLEEADPEFHARYSANGKAYTYVVHTGQKCSPFFTNLVWHYSPSLDLDTIRKAADILVGEHDFASFAVNPKREIESTVRTLHRLEITREGDIVYFNVIGNSFLYKMVRSLVGYLIHWGSGHPTLADPETVLAARDRCTAAESAPPQGLFLAQVFLQPQAWQCYRPLLPPFTLI